MLSGQNNFPTLSLKKKIRFMGYKYSLNPDKKFIISILNKNTFLISEHLSYQN
jgi:hypothetical protein